WAQRELAYEIKNYTRGVYYIMIFKALPGVVAELEKHLRFYNSDVLRFMTVTISENTAKREKPAAQESKNQNEPAETPVQTEGEN
ncbi:MAG: 30S ribosomal protein S6, partial [Thermodesulfobacteriota bacterium]